MLLPQTTLLFLLLFFLPQSRSQFPVPNDEIAPSARATPGYRLPTHINPVHYDVTLTPDFESFTFDGYLEFEFDVLEAADSITLHIYQIEVDEASVAVSGVDGVDLVIDWFEYDEERHFFVVKVALEVGEGLKMRVGYVGQLNLNNYGFYRASYTDEDGVVR